MDASAQMTSWKSPRLYHSSALQQQQPTAPVNSHAHYLPSPRRAPRFVRGNWPHLSASRQHPRRPAGPRGALSPAQIARRRDADLVLLRLVLSSDPPTSEGERGAASLRNGLENGANWGAGVWRAPPSELRLMIPNAAKHGGCLAGDAAANLPLLVPFVGFGETTTRQRLSPLRTGATGSFPKAFHPTPY